MTPEEMRITLLKSLKEEYTEPFVKLINLLLTNNLKIKFRRWYDGWQILLLDNEGKNLDDAVIFTGSYGCEKGLFETYLANDCNGYETAEDVLKEWLKIYKAKGIN